MQLKRIYIAGPYTKGDCAENVSNALRLANYIADQGYDPYVPHLTHFWHLLFPRPYRFWIDYDLRWLELCDAVVRIAGESNGAEGEEFRAHVLGLPVFIFKGFDLQHLRELSDWLQSVHPSHITHHS